MLGSSSAQLSDEEKLAHDSDQFLGSHRALAACTREFGRLAEEVGKRAATLGRETGQDAPELRLAPGRSIVQLGPVALTIAWLRSTLDTVADGRLLVIAWNGTVARGAGQSPERSIGPRAARTAVALWEETFVAAGTSEASWAWRREGGAGETYGSPELADHCVAQLRRALEVSGTPEETPIAVAAPAVEASAKPAASKTTARSRTRAK